MSLKIENSDLEKEIEKRERLGSCEVCEEFQAKYTCPKCEVHTCSLACSKNHKKSLECDGVRNKSKYIPLKKMTPMDFMNDYYFLEEATRFTKKIKSNDKVLNIKRLQQRHTLLKKAALSRKVKLFFVNTALSKRKRNFTHFDKVKDQIEWQVQLIFSSADLKIFKKFNENTKIQDIVKHVLDNYDNTKKLDFYKSQGISKLRVLLKAEGVKKNQNRHYELDSSKSLKACLENKVIIEYPTLYVVINHLMDDFEIIDSDDESIEKDQQEFLKTLHEEVFSKKVGQNPMLLVRPEEIPLMSKIIEDEIQQQQVKNSHQPKITTPQHNQVNNTCDDSCSDNEIAPENYFFS